MGTGGIKLRRSPSVRPFVCLSQFAQLPVSLHATRDARTKQTLATRRVRAADASIVDSDPQTRNSLLYCQCKGRWLIVSTHRGDIFVWSKTHLHRNNKFLKKQLFSWVHCAMIREVSVVKTLTSTADYIYRLYDVLSMLGLQWDGKLFIINHSAVYRILTRSNLIIRWQLLAAFQQRRWQYYFNS